MIQAKYFTPPLNDFDRKRLFASLGLANLEFIYVETLSKVLLQIIEVKGTDQTHILRPAVFEELSQAFGEIPIVHYRHGSSHYLDQRSISATPTLWEVLFPFPFNQLSSSQVQILPEAWANGIRKLYGSLAELENKMSETELSCLWVQGVSESMPILFHYVRKRRVRVGTCKQLESLRDEFLAGHLSSELLKSRFGTQTSFFFLSLESVLPEGNVVSELSERIQGLTQIGRSPFTVLPTPSRPVAEIRL